MKYYIIAGEASGDLHGSNLMKGIYAEDAEADVRFWGGDLMDAVYREHQNGNGYVHNYKDEAIMGFVEVLKSAGVLLRNLKACKQDIASWKPDVVILIDYPGFNFRIAEFAHKAGFKTFYYIAPKVWASREGRIRKLKKYVDQLFIVFPFEKNYFDAKGVSYIYKGNPLVDAIDFSEAANESKEDFCRRNGLVPKPIIALLAGSRPAEISTMMPVLLEMAKKMHATPQYADYEFLIAGAPARSMSDYSKYIEKAGGEELSYVKVIFGQTQNIIRHAEAAVVNSGTASLETALLGTPQVVGYITGSRLTYLIAKHIVKIKYISLGNLIINRLAFKELIQDDCNADDLAKEVRQLIENEEYRQNMLSEYACIRHELGGQGASRAVAKAMIQELHK